MISAAAKEVAVQRKRDNHAQISTKVDSGLKDSLYLRLLRSDQIAQYSQKHDKFKERQEKNEVIKLMREAQKLANEKKKIELD